MTVVNKIIKELRADCEKYYFLEKQLHKYTRDNVPLDLVQRFWEQDKFIKNKYGKILDNYNISHDDYEFSDTIDFVNGALAILDTMIVLFTQTTKDCM